MNLVKYVESGHLRYDLPKLGTGQTIRVHFRIIEGDKERVQVFEGVVIRQSGSGLGHTVTVRKISSGIGVERIFPVNSPRVARIEFVQQGKVRRARLYYLRDRIGKATKLKRVDDYVKKAKGPAR